MVEIEKIVEQNKWWKFGSEFASFDDQFREFSNSIVKFERKEIELPKGQVFILYGPRQSGKTTWMKISITKLLKEKMPKDAICYFPCDSLAAASRKELGKVIDFFLKRCAPFEHSFVFLDEINSVIDWGYEVKSLVDAGKLTNVSLILTGSPFTLKKQVELLPGRKIEGNRYFFKPLTFRDFVLDVCRPDRVDRATRDYESQRSLLRLGGVLKDLRLTPERDLESIRKNANLILPFKKELDFLLEIYLKTGGFPRVINAYLVSSYEGKKTLGEKLYETFVDVFLSDVMRQGRSERIAKQVLCAVTKKMGTCYEFRALGREMEEGVSISTLIDYLRLLEDIFYVFTLYPIDFSTGTSRPKGKKKIYFSDPFLFYSLMSYIYGRSGFELTEEILLDEKKVSAVIEGVIGSQLAMTKEIPISKSMDSFLWFHYERKGEIDYVYRRESGELLGIEVKYPGRAEEILETPHVSEYLVLTKDELSFERKIMYVPASLFLALISKGEKNF